MGSSSPDAPATTFVVRFWREGSAAGPRWRGQVDHVQSGQSARFLNLEELEAILQRFGVMADGERHTNREGISPRALSSRGDRADG